MKVYEVTVNPEPLCEVGAQAIIKELINDGKVQDDFEEITFSRDEFEKLIYDTLLKGHYAGASEIISLLNSKM